MPESDEEVQKLVEKRIGIRPCLWQIKVVRMILEQWDVIEIAATGSGKSLPYWMALIFIKHGIVVLVTPLKLLGQQFARVLEKNELKAVSMTASNSNNELLDVLALCAKLQHIISISHLGHCERALSAHCCQPGAFAE